MKMDCIIPLKLSKTNCFLVKHSNGYLLVDCGYETDKSLFEKTLKKSGVNYNEITHLLLTHHHDDHAGLLTHIVGRNPNIKIIAHKNAFELLKIGVNDETHGGGIINRRIHFLCRLYKIINKEWTLSFPPYKKRSQDVEILGDSDYLRRLGINADIIYTPGHSIDHISLVFDNGLVLAGDAAMNWLNWAGSRNVVLYVNNINQYYESWRKLIKKNAQTIYPAHGNVFNVASLKKNMDFYKNATVIPF